MKKLLALFLVSLLGTALFLAGCSGNSGGNSAGAQGGHLASTGTRDEIVFAIPNIVAKLDPQYGSAQWEWTINRTIYDSLFRAVKMDYENAIPWLCESYEVSDDGKDYTMKIREGVKFHNGDLLTVDDVIYTLERSKLSPMTAPGLEPVESFERVDDHTFIIHQSVAYPILIQVLADYQWAIVNKKAVETYGDGAREAIIGTGPYKLAEWGDDGNVTVEYFEDFWGEAPQIRKITFRIITDYAAAAIAMNSGEIDVLYYGNHADQEGFIANPDLDTNVYLRDTTLGVTMNNQAEPFSDLRVRRAINHAVDKQGMNNIAGEGVNNPDVITKTTPNAPGYSKALAEGRLTVYEYDQDKAKALLAEAGYDENNPIEASFISPSSQAAQTFSSAAQDQLAQVNVNVEVQVLESALWVQQVASGDFEMSYNDTGFMTYWAPLMYRFQYGTKAVYNRENSSIPEVDALIEQSMGERDAAAREELFAQLLSIVTEKAICCPVYQLRAVVATTKGLVVYPEKNAPLIDCYDIEWADA